MAQMTACASSPVPSRPPTRPPLSLSVRPEQVDPTHLPWGSSSAPEGQAGDSLPTPILAQELLKGSVCSPSVTALAQHTVGAQSVFVDGNGAEGI